MKYKLLSEENNAIKIEGCDPIHIKNRGQLFSGVEDVLIVTIKAPKYHEYINFIGINKKGERIWDFCDVNSLALRHPYMLPTLDDNGSLLIKNMAGKEYRIDHKTGEVIETRYENMDFDQIGGDLSIGKKKIHLTIEGEKSKEAKIKKLLSYHGEILFVLYGRGDRIDQGERVAAYDKEGNLLWDIGEDKLAFNKDGGPIWNTKLSPCKISGIGMKDDKLRIRIPQDTQVIDMKTGKILETIYNGYW